MEEGEPLWHWQQDAVAGVLSAGAQPAISWIGGPATEFHEFTPITFSLVIASLTGECCCNLSCGPFVGLI